MKKLMQIFLQQSVLNNVLYIILMVVGVFCFFKTPIEKYPEVHMGDIFITTYFHGASPVDVEKLITIKLENVIREINEVEFIKSTSTRNRSMIKVHFKDGTDYQNAITNLKMRIEGIQKDLPIYSKAPIYQEVKGSEMVPVLRFNIFGNHDKNGLSLIAKDLKVKLESIQGVDKAQIVGENIQEYHIKLSPQLMRKYGIPFQSVVSAIQSSNVNIPMGSLRVGNSEFFLSADEKFKNHEDILNLIIRIDGDGNFVRLSEILTHSSMSFQKPTLIHSAEGKECRGTNS